MQIDAPRDQTAKSLVPPGLPCFGQASILAKQQKGSDPETWGAKLCCVCGQLAKSACSKCRIARYCGREHQTLHWKTGGHKKVRLDSGVA